MITDLGVSLRALLMTICYNESGAPPFIHFSVSWARQRHGKSLGTGFRVIVDSYSGLVWIGDLDHLQQSGSCTLIFPPADAVRYRTSKIAPARDLRAGGVYPAVRHGPGWATGSSPVAPILLSQVVKGRHFSDCHHGSNQGQSSQ